MGFSGTLLISAILHFIFAHIFTLPNTIWKRPTEQCCVLLYGYFLLLRTVSSAAVIPHYSRIPPSLTPLLLSCCILRKHFLLILTDCPRYSGKEAEVWMEEVEFQWQLTSGSSVTDFVWFRGNFPLFCPDGHELLIWRISTQPVQSAEFSFFSKFSSSITFLICGPTKIPRLTLASLRFGNLLRR